MLYMFSFSNFKNGLKIDLDPCSKRESYDEAAIVSLQSLVFVVVVFHLKNIFKKMRIKLTLNLIKAYLVMSIRSSHLSRLFHAARRSSVELSIGEPYENYF